jgi:hypothetical protein
MWEKLGIRERERRLGLLFLIVLLTVPVASAVAMAFPLAGRMAGFSVLGLFWLATLRRMLALREAKWGSAPVGPLSPDEKAKARSKLLATTPPQRCVRRTF